MLQHHPEVEEWVYGIIHEEPEPPGDFLRCFAQAVVRADADNYATLHGAVVTIMRRFPKYKCTCQKWEE